jgi:hypothetical protein
MKSVASPFWLWFGLRQSGSALSGAVFYGTRERVPFRVCGRREPVPFRVYGEREGVPLPVWGVR